MRKDSVDQLVRLMIPLLVGMLLCSAFSGAVVANGDNIVEFMKSGDYSYSIGKSDDSGVDLAFSLDDYQLGWSSAEGMTFQSIDIENAGSTSAYGSPELPVVSFYVAVPQDAEIEWSYQTDSITNIEDIGTVYPAQPAMPETDGYVDPEFAYLEDVYESDSYFPEKTVEIGEVFTMRGCRMVMVNIMPIQYNPVLGTIRVTESVDVDIEFVGGSSTFIPERLRSSYFDPILRSYVVNAASLEEPTEQQVGKGERADLLIVAADQFVDGIEPLAEWRHKSGIETKVVAWSDIGATADDLIDYMEDAYNNWELPPSFLLIIGDADHVPVNYKYSHPYNSGYTGTDLWYTAIDGDDFFPDIHMGRISVEDEDQLEVVVDKILEYSTDPYLGSDWLNGVLLASYEEYGRYFVWGCETVYSYLEPLGYDIDRQYEGGSPSGSTSGIVNAINNGVGLVSHRDHGASQNSGSSYTGWSHPSFDTDAVLSQLDNQHMYPVGFSINCESGWFDGETDGNSNYDYESFPEVGIRAENKGFVAVVASTRVSWSGFNDEMHRGYYDAMFPEFISDYPNGGGANPMDDDIHMIGMVVNYGKFFTHDVYYLPGGCDPYPWTPTEENCRTTFEMFHVHGDPTMDVYTEVPEDLAVSYVMNEQGLVVSVTSSKGPVADAVVCVSQENGIYVKGTTDASGEVTLDVSDGTPEIASLVVSAHNYVPYSEEFYLNKAPETPSAPTGPTVVSTGSEATYRASTTDPEEDDLYYQFDWGDGTKSDWVGPVSSGTEVSATHIWTSVDDFDVTVCAKDSFGSIGEFSDPLVVHAAGPILAIGNMTGGFTAKIDLLNTGDEEAVNVEYNITVESTYPMFYGGNKQGTIDSIPAGGSVKIKSAPIFTLGKHYAYLSVTAQVPDRFTEVEEGSGMIVRLIWISVNP